MKKLYTILLFSLCLGFNSLAQTNDCSTAVAATTGSNSFAATADTPYWFTYDLPVGKKLTLSSTGFFDTEMSSGTDCNSRNNYTYGNPSTSFTALQDGGTVYIRIYPYSSETISFDLIEEDFVPGDLCSNAVAATTGSNSFAATENTLYWLTYDLPAAKKLSITSSNSGSIRVYQGSNCNNLFNSSSGFPNLTYTDLETGGTLYIRVRPNNTETFTFDLIEENFAPGDLCSNAVAATTGSNSFAATENTLYWFTYDLPVGKKLTLSSTGNFETEMSSGTDCNSRNNYTYGYPSTSFTALQDGGTVYIRIYPYSSETISFDLIEEDFAPGDLCSNAVAATTGSNSFAATADTPYWFTYDLPVGKKLTLSSTGNFETEMSSGTDCNSRNNYTYGYPSTSFTALQDGGTVYIRIYPYSSETISFDLIEEDFAPGDLCSNAVAATTGSNSFAATADTPYWFTYDLPVGKKLTLSSTGNFETEMSSGTDCNSRNNYTYGYPSTSFTALQDGGTVYIRIYPYSSETISFDLIEEDFAPGDLCSNAVAATTGSNSFAATENTLYWLTYDLPAAKKLSITSSNSGSIRVYQGSNCDNLFNSSTGFPNLAYTDLETGGTLYIRVRSNNTETFTFDLIEEDIEPGDNCANPVAATTGSNSFAATADTPYWFTYDLPVGKKLTLSSTGNFETEMSSGTDCNSRNNYTYGNPSTSFTALQDGGTVYIRIYPYSSETISFDLIEEDFAPGDLCSNAVAATTGSNSFAATENTLYWFTYDLPVGKKLTLSSTGNFETEMSSGTDCNSRNNYTYGYPSTSFTALQDGGTVYIRIYPYSSETISFDLIEEDFASGDLCSNAVAATTGSNSFAATENTLYWLTYDLPAAKKLSITSSNSGSIRVYQGSNCDNLFNSSTGFPNLTYTDLETGGTLYIRVRPNNTETFTFDLIEEDIEPGDNCANPVAATTGSNSFAATADTPYWFTYDLPVGKKLTLSSTGNFETEMSSGTDCNSRNNYTYGNPSTSFTALQDGGTVYIRIYPYSSETISFDLIEENFAPGDLCSNAVAATTGSNSFAATENTLYWLTYDLPAAKKLSITSSNSGSIRVYQGSNCDNLFNSSTGFPNLTYTDLETGGTLYIRVRPNNTETFTFDLIEEDIEPGDNCANPVAATTGSNSFAATADTPYWFTYDLPVGKKLTLSSTGNFETEMSSGTDCNSRNNYTYGNPSTSLTELQDGGTVYIRIYPYSSETISFDLIEEDFAPGDLCSNPATAVEGTNSIPSTNASSYWYTFTMPADVDQKLVIEAGNDRDISVYSGTCSSLLTLNSSDGALKELGASANEEVYIEIQTSNTGNFDWTLSVEPIGTGDDCQNPEQASAGTNFTPVAPHWFTYTAPVAGTYTISSFDLATGDTYVRVYSDCQGTSIVQNDDFNGTRQSQVELQLTENQTIFILWDDNFNAEGFDWSITSDVIVDEPQNQTITFNTLSPMTFGDADFDLTATTSSSLTVDYSSSNTAVATVTGSTVTIVGVGTTTITASQAGNGSFNAADPVEQILTVEKANQTITFNSLDPKTFGDANFNLTATTSSNLTVDYTSSNTAVATVIGSTVTIVGAGSTVITATQDGDTEYNAASSVEQTLTVNKADQTISFAEIDDKQIYESFPIPASIASGLTISYEVTGPANESGGTVSLTSETGTVTITASQAGNNNYNAASPVTQEFLVTDPNKTDQSITFDALDVRTFGDEDFDLDLTGGASSGLPLSFESSNTSVATVNGTILTVVGVGSTVLTASQSGNATFNPAIPVSQILIVTEADQTIDFDPIPAKTFGDSSFDLPSESSAGLPVTYISSNTDVAVIDGITVTIVGVGTAEITAVQGGNSEFNAASSVVQTITIEKADQTISVDPITNKEANAAPFNIVASTDSNLDLDYSLIGPASLSGNIVTLDGTSGTVTVTVSQAGNVNFNAASTEVSFDVTDSRISQTISFEALSDKVYGDEGFNLTASTSSELDVSFELVEGPVSLNAGAVSITGAGIVTIRALQNGDDEYSAADPVEQSFQITKAPLTVSADNKEMIYAAALPEFTFQVTGFVYSEDESVLTSPVEVGTVANESSNVGEYAINASGAAAANYEISYEAAVLTILRASQTISFEPAEKVDIEQSNEFTLQATASSNLEVSYDLVSGPASLNGKTLTLTGTGIVNLVASQAGNDNYEAAAEVNRSIEIFSSNKEEQTITFEALDEKTFGDADFDLTATASSDLAVTYTSSDETVATIDGSTVTIVGAGTTTITAIQEGNADFNPASPISQALVVNKADQEITIESIADQDIEAADFEVVASTTSELELTYTILSGPATISGNLISLTGEVGTVEIEVSQAGNENYNAASATISFDVFDDPCQGFAATASLIQNASCNGEVDGSFEVTITAGTAPFTFSIGNESQDNGLFENQAAGSYEIIVMDANGCTATTTVEITEPEAIEVTAEVTDSNSINGNGSITLTVTGGSGNFTFDWSNGETTANLSDLELGEYSVIVTDEAGCSITESYTIGGVTANSEAFELNIYPNPVIDQVQVVHGAKVNQISLIDANGKIIVQQKTTGAASSIEMKSLPAGMYFIRLDDGKMKRIIKD